MAVTFANGDQFGARATASGQVQVYRNGMLLGTRDVTAWPYYANGGYIGLWFINAGNAVFDNFGGGSTVSGAAPLAFQLALTDGHYRLECCFLENLLHPVSSLATKIV
jgi:hypothetical protein